MVGGRVLQGNGRRTQDQDRTSSSAPYLCKETGSGDKAIQGTMNKNNQTAKWLGRRGTADTQWDQSCVVDLSQKSRTGGLDTKAWQGLFFCEMEKQVSSSWKGLRKLTDNAPYCCKEFSICGNIMMFLWCRVAFRNFLLCRVCLKKQKFRRGAFSSKMCEYLPGSQVDMYDMPNIGQI